MTLFWEEDDEDGGYQVPDDIVDLSFRISCPCLPLDHAAALSEAVHAVLPWLSTEERAGLHLIHGAASGNGWTRPDEAGESVLYPSKRTRMTLRLPRERVDEARVLSGKTLDIEGYALTLGDSNVRPLTPLPTLFARYVVGARDQDEGAFMEVAAEELRNLGIRPRKVMCGRTNTINLTDGELFTRSMMVADLEPHESVILQQYGIGPRRRLGCGVFVGHKGVRPVDEAASHAGTSPRF